MEANETHSVLPTHSFLVDRQYFHFDDFCHSMCLLTFAAYDEDGKLCYIYHLLKDEVFTHVFASYFDVMIYLRELT
jgi:hypothetical protein